MSQKERMHTGELYLPGVSIGEGSVIGAGSVVTKDIPAGVVAVGNPCKVLREIGEKDKKYYFGEREIDYTDPDIAAAFAKDKE